MRIVHGSRPAVAPSSIWQSNTLTRFLQSILVVPLTTNMERASLAGTAIIKASAPGPPEDSVALAFQMRATNAGPLSGAGGPIWNGSYQVDELKSAPLLSTELEHESSQDATLSAGTVLYCQRITGRRREYETRIL